MLEKYLVGLRSILNDLVCGLVTVVNFIHFVIDSGWYDSESVL